MTSISLSNFIYYNYIIILKKSQYEKKKEVEEIRPTEETYKIDPENEHEKQRQKEDLNDHHHKPKYSDDESDEDDESGENYESQEIKKLDIVV